MVHSVYVRFYFPAVLLFWAANGQAALRPVLSPCSALYRYFNQSSIEEILPFNLADLEAAISPELNVDRKYNGEINRGLWRYRENGKEYFIKGIGGRHSAKREIKNAQMMAKLGIGPQVFPFKSSSGQKFLISEFVPGINSKEISFAFDFLVIHSKPYNHVELANALNLPHTSSWRTLTTAYAKELIKHRASIVVQLKRIRALLQENNFRAVTDFQFIVNLNAKNETVELKVIDTSLFRQKRFGLGKTDFSEIDRMIHVLERMKIR